MSTSNVRARCVSGLVAAAAALSLALAPAAISPGSAAAQPKAPTAKCKAGDIKEETTTTTVNGQSTTTTKKYVCNKKGVWRPVKDLRAGAVDIAVEVSGAVAQR